MFGWLFGKGKPPKESETMVFLRNLCKAETGSVQYSYYAYTNTADIIFPSVRVELRYNDIRRNWKLDVRDRRTSEALYGYYKTWDSPPSDVVQFLLDQFRIWDVFSVRIAQKKETKEQNQRSAEDLKKKFLDME